MARRRRRGTGSVYQRQDGRWVAQLNDESGHRVAFYAATRAEAEDRLTDARHRNRQGLRLTHGRQTLDAYLRGWLERKRSHVRVSTWSTYRGHLGRYVLGKPIGSVQLVDLRAEHLATLYRDLEGSVSPQTVRHVATILRQALKSAVDAGEIARNPADGIKTARVSRSVMVTLTPKQVEALLRAANGDELEALWVLAVTMGMRLGELLGLRWRSVDAGHKHLSVETSLTANGQRATLTEPKTAGSRRRVSLSGIAIEALRDHRWNERERVKNGEREISSNPDFADLVFTNRHGDPLDGRKVTSMRFKALLKKAGLPDMRFHDLRHTAATLLLGAGTHPKVVSAMLGHSTIAVTLDLYSHVSDSMTHEAAASMDRLVRWVPEPAVDG